MDSRIMDTSIMDTCIVDTGILDIYIMDVQLLRNFAAATSIQASLEKGRRKHSNKQVRVFSFVVFILEV